MGASLMVGAYFGRAHRHRRWGEFIRPVFIQVVLALPRG